jgi:amino acid permease
MLGGDKRINELRVGLVTNSGESSLFPNLNGAERPDLSMFGAVMIFVKAALATDPFLMVYLFQYGFVQTFIICLLLILLTQASYAVLLRSWWIGEAYTMTDLWARVIGTGTAWVPRVLMLFAYIACLSSEYWEICECVPPILDYIWPDAPDILFNEWFLQYVPMVIILVAMSSARNFRSLLGISIVGLVATIVGLLCAFVYLVRHHFEGGRYVPTSETVYFELEFMSIYDALRDFNGALFAHPVLAYVGAEMRHPSRNQMSSMTWISMVITGIACYAVPLLGYLVAPDVEPDSMYFYFFESNDSPEVILGILSALILSLTSNLFFTFLVGRLFVSLWSGDHVGDRHEHSTSTGASILTAACGALLSVCINFTNDWVWIVWYDTATFAYSFLGFFLPGLFYLVQYRLRVFGWGVLSCLIVALGGFLMVLTIIGMVQGLMELA